MYFSRRNSRLIISLSPSSSQLEADHTSTDQDSLLLSEVLPQDSASQSQSFLRPVKKARAAPATQWIWNHFSTREVARAWAEKRTGKKRTRDMDISCTVVDGKTGKQCGWATADSQRAQSTSNMQRHLAKSHSILPPESQGSTLNVPDIRRSFKKQGHLTVQDCLERNILRWIIQTKQPFCVLEAASFQQIFADLSSVSSESALSRLRISADWVSRSTQRRQEWSKSCASIGHAAKFIEYDVDTRWNSTFRLLDDGLESRAQIDLFLLNHGNQAIKLCN
ncbi:hypothetical protein N7535_001302 [Penicillium sp. DV-2018c]|nr:hypothetical protein N7535_001302 [Penicillium sp. DV-2018c]